MATRLVGAGETSSHEGCAVERGFAVMDFVELGDLSAVVIEADLATLIVATD